MGSVAPSNRLNAMLSLLHPLNCDRECYLALSHIHTQVGSPQLPLSKPLEMLKPRDCGAIVSKAPF